MRNAQDLYVVRSTSHPIQSIRLDKVKPLWTFVPTVSSALRYDTSLTGPSNGHAMARDLA